MNDFNQALLDKALEQAQDFAKRQTALTVEATPAKQAGQDILVGACPRCRNVAALSGEGKHLCRACGQWLDYKAKS